MNKNEYREFLTKESTVPLFSQAWWLDATAGGGHWDVALVKKDSRITATMPYYIKKRFGFTLLTQPPLTQTLGPWLAPSTAKYANQLGLQKDTMEELLSQLPAFDNFSQNWHHLQKNWLPFYWQGFKQTTRYTYQLQNLRDEKKLWEGMLENIRREIRKAENRHGLQVRDDLDIEAFLSLNRKTFLRQGMPPPYTDELVRGLDRACLGHQCRKIWIAEDAQGRHHAGVYIVWDENSAYYLMGGGDPEFRTSGATSLCMWTAIRHAATVSQCFDFEGSMIEPVERFVRAFGAVQVLYFNITKTPSRLLRARQGIIDWSKG